jgi:hypothetical protein
MERGDDDWALCPLETDTGTLSLSDFLWDRGEVSELFVGSRVGEQDGPHVASWYLESAARVQPWDLLEYSDTAASPANTMTKPSSTQNAGPIDLNLVDAVPLEPLTRRLQGEGGKLATPLDGGGKLAGLWGNFDSEVSWAQETLWSRDFRRSLWERGPEASTSSSSSEPPAPPPTTSKAAAASATTKMGTAAGRGAKRKEPPEEIVVIDDDGPAAPTRQAAPAPKRGKGAARGKGRKK